LPSLLEANDDGLHSDFAFNSNWRQYNAAEQVRLAHASGGLALLTEVFNVIEDSDSDSDADEAGSVGRRPPPHRHAF